MALTRWVLHYSVVDLSLLFAVPVVLLITLHLIGGYDRRTDFLSLGYFSEHLVGLVLAAVGATLSTYLFSSYHDAVKPSRLFVPMVVGLFAFPSLYLRRVLGLRLYEQSVSRSILVLGAGEKARSFYRDYAASHLGWKLEFLTLSQDSTQEWIDGLGSAPVVRNGRERLEQTGSDVTAVLLACGAKELSSRVLHRLVQMHCSDMPVYTVESFYEKHLRRVSVGAVNAEWLFDSEFRLAQGSVSSHLKRIFDVLFSIVGLVLTSPVLLLAMLVIRWESRGNPLFRQERVGRDGRIFVMYKLRTMRLNDGEMCTRVGDQRITPFGHWLRLTRLDEIPQLLNVLRGDMSLIGPRAEWVKCTELYEQQIPNYHLRHLVKPGITGWAQVNYPYGENERDTIEKLQYDLYYIRNFSLKLDFSIVLKTFYTMVAGKGR